MKKEYTLQKDAFLKIADILHKDFKGNNYVVKTSTHIIYESYLIVPLVFKTELPFQFPMKIEIIKEGKNTQLEININLLKLYIFSILFVLLLIVFANYLDSYILLSAIGVLPFILYRFYLNIKKQISVVEGKLLSDKKEVI